jgi:ferric-dicitrate binding protein FerR (iron transport regulator)
VSGPGDDLPAAELAEERVLRASLRVNPLSPQTMARIRRAIEAEWRANVRRPPARMRAQKRIAIAATLLLIGLGGIFLLGAGPGAAPGEQVARLIRSESPGVFEEHALIRNSLLAEGATLRAGQTYEVGGQALVELTGGGNLRIAAGSEFEVLALDDVRLEHGELYVDIPPGAHANAAFIARTSAGEFRHVGTQFALAVRRDETRLRVREGSVHWLAAGGESTVRAGTEVVFNIDTKSAERAISPGDPGWDWTARTTPDFDIENRPLGEFLTWVARESGRELVLVDDRARARAAAIRMHGSVRGLTPMQALSAVMATTELRFDLSEGQIRVSFAGDTTRK